MEALMKRIPLPAIFALLFTSGAVTLFAADSIPQVPLFTIEVVDDQTGRGVPLVELTTVSGTRYVTDSAGVVAVDDPALFGREVFFTIKSHGYEFPADGFGLHGKRLKVEPGETATLKIKRLNIAE